jgi:signal transduction histidine kinase
MWAIRLQTALVIALFLGSLATVLFSTFLTLLLPQNEFEVRDRLRAASQRMAEAAAPELPSLQVEGGRPFEAHNAKLRGIATKVLADYPGVEGGFYLDAGFEKFAGYAFPTDPQGFALLPSDGPLLKGKLLPKGKGPPPPRPGRGDEPPPKEKPFILLQAQKSLSLAAGEFQFDVRTVGPSRVAILTEPAGPERPARLATWTMFRITRPESTVDQLRRFQVSTAMALGGIALAVVLTLNLGRTLKRQRLEQERLRGDQDRLRDELRRSEHLAALGTQLAGVAHEVRNPLAGIRSTVQLWQRWPDMARSPESLDAVIRAVDRLNEIVSAFLYFSRADCVERLPVKVNEVLTETLKLLEVEAAAQAVVVKFNLEPDLPLVQGSANGLRQVFLNLATNALQAMPQGGRLECSTRLLAPKDRIEIRFADTGSGITSDAQKHLFEPFFTTRFDGTGLGLALCREIVLQHGGQIELGTGGQGTTFRVILPVAQ